MNKVHTPLVREYGFQSPENFCSSKLESQILSFEIGNTPWGIQNLTDDWNTESKFHWPKKKNKQTPVPGILSWIPIRRANVTSTFSSAHSTTLFAVDCHVSRISSAFTSPRPRCTHCMAIFAAAATYKSKHDSCYVSARAARKLKLNESKEKGQRGEGQTRKKVSPSPLPVSLPPLFRPHSNFRTMQ